ncbi:TTL-domain-containing protein [Acaromyces ingoldii]|uniref:TTL-domain-containing protein n=1 Tax=Acaromyces ingoldii TaxID=215250 RepID=A0A316YPM4_9BASI|nr:TTL-domain-containing protein [Acaromyces ingoldii]PWN90608.1 TTL-domain-containing protein [Acaromyces ingoldii]
MTEGKLRAWISFPGAPYTQASAVKACGDVLLPLGWEIEEGDGSEAPVSQQLYLADYDLLPFEQLHPASFTPDSIKPLLPQLSSYPIRKSLIRKNYLASSLHAAQLKKGSNKRITPATWVFEATCADDLDELLMDDLYDVREALEKGEGKWFILKPAMADRGMGIRLFNSVDTLREIFDEFDAEDSDGESEQESEQGKEEGKTEEKEAERQTQEQEQTQKGEAERAYYQTASTVVMMSQLRHFVIQDYICDPFLVTPPGASQKHKFHLRAYVLAQGSLRVFLYDEILALFAPLPYAHPSSSPDGSGNLRAHLTNTCLQGATSFATVHLLDDLKDRLGGQAVLDDIKRQTNEVVAEAFSSAASAGRIHLQTWPHAWELFGVDLIVSNAEAGASPSVLLLEINAQPDFAQSGPELQGKIDQLFTRTLQITVLDQGTEAWSVGESRDRMTLSLDLTLSAGGW